MHKIARAICDLLNTTHRTQHTTQYAVHAIRHTVDQGKYHDIRGVLARPRHFETLTKRHIEAHVTACTDARTEHRDNHVCICHMSCVVPTSWHSFAPHMSSEVAWVRPTHCLCGVHHLQQPAFHPEVVQGQGESNRRNQAAVPIRTMKHHSLRSLPTSLLPMRPSAPPCTQSLCQ